MLLDITSRAAFFPNTACITIAYTTGFFWIGPAHELQTTLYRCTSLCTQTVRTPAKAIANAVQHFNDFHLNRLQLEV